MATLLQASRTAGSGTGYTTCGTKKKLTSASNSSLFGGRLKQSLSVRRSAPKSPSLVWSASVWWSDAAKELLPDWQKAHIQRVEVLQALENEYEAGIETTPPVQQSSFLKEFIAVGKDAVLGGGLAQEMIIGRTAMLGFLAAMTVEIESGCTVWQQFTVRGGVALAMVSLAVVAGSLAPKVNEILKKEIETPVKPFRGFTSTAERLNGQAAMVGFVLLLATEYVKGSAVF